MSTASSKEVRDFFDRIAPQYRDRYTGGDAFHEYFFGERLSEATRDLDVRGRRILDVGAGTGKLYDHLLLIDPNIDYYANDVSSAMLENSNIPPQRRFAGQVQDLDLKDLDFDLIFMLGVTTYQNDEDLTSTLRHLRDLIRPGGKLVITFTNPNSIDWLSRRFIKAVGRVFIPKGKVLAQSFQINPRGMNEAMALVRNMGFRLEKMTFLNHTIFPVNQLLKRPSSAVARKIHALGNTSAKEWLSSDFLMVLTREDAA